MYCVFYAILFYFVDYGVIYHAFNILIAKAIHIRDNFLKLEHANNSSFSLAGENKYDVDAAPPPN
jgi:hypothetical protein